MKPIDYLLGAIIAFTFIYGIKRGLVKEVASFAGLLLGGAAASLFSADLARLLERSIPLSPRVGIVISFLLIFLAVNLSFHFLGLFFHILARMFLLSWLDHLLGGLFGLFKAGLILLLLVFLVAFKPLPPKAQTWIDESYIISTLRGRMVDHLESCRLCPFRNRAEMLKLIK